MAIQNATIQHRRGALKDFDAAKMLPGEFAVTTDGSRKVLAAFAAGDVKELASKEEVKQAIAEGVAAIEEKEQEALQNIGTGVDSSLKEYGKAADAGATGKAIDELKSDFENHISNHPSGDGSGGVNGKDGVGISSVEQTTISTDDGGINVVTVTKTDGTTSNFQIRNGSKGNKGDTGEKGDKGEPGIDGITPTIGDNGNWYLGDNDTGKPSRGEIVKAVPRRGTAVVFGDSYFENPTAGYDFGDWLANQGAYNTVYNHAYEGSGFGNTYQYRSGYSLYELLISGSATGQTPDGKTNYADIRQHVREADAIYIHLGGNDVFSQGGKLAEVKVENDLQNKVKLCLEKINEFNNHAVIYYALPGTVSEYATMKKAIVPSVCDDGEPYDKLLRRIYSIQIAVAKSDANVVISKSKGSDFAYRMYDDTLHYTKECAEIFFDRLLYGDYGTKYITDFYINAPNDVTSETDASTISGLITDGIVANTPKLVYCPLSENIVYTNIFTQEHVDPYLYRFSFENYMSQYGGFIKLYIAFKKDGTFESKGYLLQSTQLN